MFIIMAGLNAGGLQSNYSPFTLETRTVLERFLAVM